MAIQLKRAYEKPQKGDGFRVLIDRIWPRGVRKEDLKLDQWLRTLAPSTELREWFGHDPDKWDEFRKRYLRELDTHPDEIKLLRQKMRAGTLTIVFGSREERFNNATALKEYLEQARSAAPRVQRATPRRVGRARKTVGAAR